MTCNDMLQSFDSSVGRAVDCSEKVVELSIGRWFKSGSKDILLWLHFGHQYKCVVAATSTRKGRSTSTQMISKLAMPEHIGYEEILYLNWKEFKTFSINRQNLPSNQ